MHDGMGNSVGYLQDIERLLEKFKKLGSHHDHVCQKDEEFPDALDDALFSQHVSVCWSLRDISKLQEGVYYSYTVLYLYMLFNYKYIMGRPLSPEVLFCFLSEVPVYSSSNISAKAIGICHKCSPKYHK